MSPRHRSARSHTLSRPTESANRWRSPVTEPEMRRVLFSVAAIIVLIVAAFVLVRLAVPFVWGLDFAAAPAAAVVLLLAGLAGLYFLAVLLFRLAAKQPNPRAKDQP